MDLLIIIIILVIIWLGTSIGVGLLVRSIKNLIQNINDGKAQVKAAKKRFDELERDIWK